MSLEACKDVVKDDVRYKGDYSSPVTYKKGDQHILLGSVGNTCQRKIESWAGNGNGDILHNIFWITKNMKNPIYCSGK